MEKIAQQIKEFRVNKTLNDFGILQFLKGLRYLFIAIARDDSFIEYQRFPICCQNSQSGILQ